MREGNSEQQRSGSFGQESTSSNRQQESMDQDVSSKRDQNSQSGSAWENYRTRELGSGGQQRQEGIEGRSEESKGNNRGNLAQDDMD
ncbi:hypothetical protein [Flaviaesturariibacter terrae]